MADYDLCTSVTELCPVEATTYGYTPNLAANVLFVAIWAALAISQTGLAIYYKTWSYSFVLAAGSIMEGIGYIGRVLMNGNPWSSAGFRTQVICLIMAPSFLAAGVYLTVKHIVLYYGPEQSRIKPKFYTWIFIGCDVASICIQAIGGGLAASADGGNKALLDAGNGIILAGIGFQIVTMIICGLLVVDFGLRVRKNRTAVLANPSSDNDNEKPIPESSGTRGRIFMGAIVFAYFTILIRCIYRYVPRYRCKSPSDRCAVCLRWPAAGATNSCAKKPTS